MARGINVAGKISPANAVALANLIKLTNFDTIEISNYKSHTNENEIQIL